MKELVTVVVPVYNRKELVKRTLESILSQNYHPMEIIIVDNGSTDGTRAEMEKWLKSRKPDNSIQIKILDEQKKGASAARNRGFKEASGEFVIFFDSDDLMRNDLVSKAINEFRKSPDTEVVAWRCNLKLLDGREKVPAYNPSSLLESHLIHSLLRPQGFMAKREFLEKTGPWNEELPGWNDWEYGLRIILKNPSVAVIPDILADVYSQKDSITGENFSAKAGMWEKALDSAIVLIEENNYPDKEKLKKIVSYRKIILAAHYAREGNKEAACGIKKEELIKLPRRQRIILNFSFHYTRLGGRGAWRIIKNFY